MGKTESEIKAILASDDKLNEQEQAEILLELNPSSDSIPPSVSIDELDEILKEEPSVQFKGKEKVNAYELVKVEDYVEDDVRKIKYDNKNWRTYIEQERKLNGMSYFEFYKVKAVGIFDTTVDRNGNKVLVLKGIQVNGKPERKITIDANTARTMNDQIWNSQNNKDASVYYLYADAVEV